MPEGTEDRTMTNLRHWVQPEMSRHGQVIGYGIYRDDDGKPECVEAFTGNNLAISLELANEYCVERNQHKRKGRTMTVSELREMLKAFDDTDLICIDPNGYHHGIFPAEDKATPYHLSAFSYDTQCVVLKPSHWPWVRI